MSTRRVPRRSCANDKPTEVGQPYRRGDGGRFDKGNPQGPGRGPRRGAPNAGRPPDALKALAREGTVKAVELAIKAIDGEATEKIVAPDGTVTELRTSPTMMVRLKAGELCAKVAGVIGTRVDVEHAVGKPTLNIVEQIVRKL